MKKTVAAKRPSFVERELSTGGTIRIPYKIKKAAAGRPAKFQVAGPLKLTKVALPSAELQSTVKTKSVPDGGTVWLLIGPLWLKSNEHGTDVVNPIQRDVKKVLAALKKQVAAGQGVR
jgi:hypothetical protein